MLYSKLYSEPFLRFLEIVNRGTRADRQAIALVSSSAQPLFSAAFEIATVTAYGSSTPLKAHACLTAIVRTIWNMAPIELFVQPAPDFKYLAAKAIRENIPSISDESQLVPNLAVIFKRLRRFHRFGRDTTSFSNASRDHLQILDGQSWRCAHCLFKFETDLDVYAGEEDGMVVDRSLTVPGELRLAATYRRPELDHIIPHLIGGDSMENWQILCKSCNLGKSDAISGLARQFSQISVRVDDLYTFSASKRYAVIADVGGHDVDLASVPDTDFVRIFKKSDRGFLNIENLCCRIS